MCGDIEEDDRLEADPLLGRFLSNARWVLARSARQPAADPADGEAALHGYLDKLYADALGRSLRDAAGVEPGEAYQRLAMQAVVFARLAGYLAGHVRLKEDPLRKLMEAVMHGYGEAETHNLAERHWHGHDHDEDDHGHAHHHGHEHDHGHAHPGGHPHHHA